MGLAIHLRHRLLVLASSDATVDAYRKA